ncbi:cytochrome P450 [Actinoplanes sp. NPDC049548]|uniref:cytochrome P450 n=1 Tax=Actinoplanes sp. NPDC049548 TaxID=3155152 RepID=UPI003435D42B
MTTVHREALDLADPAFWRRPPAQRLGAFRVLRALDRPAVCGDGAYALLRHRDVVAASRTPEVFVSGPGVTTPKPAAWVRFVFGDSMVNLDDPRHARLRAIVGRAFTPRVLARISDDVQRTAIGIVDDVTAGRPADFVRAVAARMPFEIICGMMGIPASYRRELLGQILRAGEGTEVRRRPRVPGRSLRALARMHRVVGRVARQRRHEPGDDLISALVTAEVDGSGLTRRELGSFFSLLLVAGVETTRNAIAHGLHLLTANPEQRALLAGDFDRYAAGFVDEVVRHSSPIIQFRRTVARDHELNGYPLRAGDEVVLCYAAANRDETVFADPDVFDITRRPNPHVGFGGGGPHFCLGTALARQEMTVLFRELLTRLPDIRSVGEPELVASSFDNRVGRLRFAY